MGVVDEIFSGFNIGGIGVIASIILVFFLSILIVGGIGAIIFLKLKAKQYKYRIHLFQKVGNTPTRIAIYKAKAVAMGRAGDYLWYVAGAKKYIPPATMQSAPNEFWHWVREDEEWINFFMEDLDVKSKEAGIKYIHQDMRMQRLATDKLLEQRLLKKSFWDKYGNIIMHILFLILIMIALVVIFQQYAGIVDRTGDLLDTANRLLQEAAEIRNPTAKLIPVT